MSRICDEVQEQLAEHGPTGLQQNIEAQEHLVDCQECFTLLESLGEVDAGLESMDAVDPPASLVEQTMTAIRESALARQRLTQAAHATPDATAETAVAASHAATDVTTKVRTDAVTEAATAPAPGEDSQPSWWQRTRTLYQAAISTRKWTHLVAAGAASSVAALLLTVTLVGPMGGRSAPDMENMRFSEFKQPPGQSAAAQPRSNAESPDEAVEEDLPVALPEAEPATEGWEGDGREIGGNAGGSAGGYGSGSGEVAGQGSLGKLIEIEKSGYLESRKREAGQMDRIQGAEVGDEARSRSLRKPAKQVLDPADSPAHYGFAHHDSETTTVKSPKPDPAKPKPLEWALNEKNPDTYRGDRFNRDKDSDDDGKARFWDEEKELKKKAKSEEEVSRRQHAVSSGKKNQLRESSKSEAIADRKRAIQQKVAGDGLLKILGARGPGAATGGEISDVFSEGGLAGDLDGAMDGLAGVGVTADQSELDASLSNLNTFGTQARIVPHFENGEAKGFKLFAVKPGSVYAKLGIKNGDVVQRINGHELSSPDKALEVYSKLKESEQIRVDLKRNGQALTLAYNISGGGELVVQQSPGATYLERRTALDDLSFKDATGYWANTYVPGDPGLRLLQAQLRGRDRAVLQQAVSTPLALHDSARQTTQPFDIPANSAVAVYLHADRSGLDGSGRMLVQVGIQGTQRHSGLRSAMNVGVVFDLRDVSAADETAAFRALAETLSQTRQTGDRFTLAVAGRPGGVVVGAKQFSYGAVRVAMQNLFASADESPLTDPAPTLSLAQATQQVIDRVSHSDDPTAPLGTSVVLIVTAGRLGAEQQQLARLAHQSAVDGVPVSAIGVGKRFELAELDQLALAGQGNRRLMLSAADAKGVVARELTAASRAVARAMRLRIRLAPGVKLIDVLASKRLDEARAQQVREAEQSIDLRMARSLGIQADRGEDEEGIQIVIPTFYSGDAHTILLDVVAEQAGPIADVTVRYKDLVYLRNGIARANLSLGRTPQLAGTLELNVLKNALALELSDLLRQAGSQIQNGQTHQALLALRQHQQLLQSLRRELPRLDHDPDLRSDLGLLSEYVALLESEATEQPIQRIHLAESLRYAGFLKVLPQPLAGDRAAHEL